jgi:Tfp pilus assembly protein PilV
MSGPYLWRPGRAENGFTLIELMLAIIVVVVGILGMASTMASMTRYQDLSASRTDMGALADNKFEQLRAAAQTRSADTVQLIVGGSLTVDVVNHNDAVTERGRTYTRRWLVTAGVGGSRNVALRITPQVDDNRTPARIDFQTLITP